MAFGPSAEAYHPGPDRSGALTELLIAISTVRCDSGEFSTTKHHTGKRPIFDETPHWTAKIFDETPH